MNLPLIIDTIRIHRDAEDRYCLNDLHRAAVAAGEDYKRCQTEHWLRNDGTQALISELEAANKKCGIQQKQAVTKRPGAPETGGGTYVVKELVYAYAMWISPAFHLKVIRAYDAIATAAPAFDPDTMSRLDLIQMLLKAETERLEASEKLLELEPKAEGFDRLIEADGAVNLVAAAKALQQRPYKFVDWLRENRWIYRRAGGKTNYAYQNIIQEGLMRHKVTVLNNARDDGLPKMCEQVLVTPKGLRRLALMLGVDQVL